MFITGWQILAFAFYTASAIAVFSLVLLYMFCRADKEKESLNNAHVMATTVLAVLWPATLPAFGIVSAIVMIRYTGLPNRGGPSPGGPSGGPGKSGEPL